MLAHSARELPRRRDRNFDENRLNVGAAVPSGDLAARHATIAARASADAEAAPTFMGRGTAKAWGPMPRAGSTYAAMACLAVSASLAKASGSFTARSARILRSRSTPDFFKP
jgi:hypothetical protein